MIIGTVLLGIAIGFFAPSPFVSVTGPAPAGSLPSFNEATKSKTAEEQPPLPETGENPRRRALRAAVLHAAGELEFNPCDKKLRKRLVEAIRPSAASIQDGPPEFILVNGKKKNVSKRYDKPATDAIFKALLAGHLDARDLAGPWGRMFLKAQSAGCPRKAPCGD